jgi:2,3,4,5-tetrahydropyridine-2-carboxylate N-succinyltransferase
MFEDFLRELESGTLRTARKIDGQWQVDASVKDNILRVFKESPIVQIANGFSDKEPFSLPNLKPAFNVRVVPGGTSIRRGAHCAQNVVIMPPSFINIGAFIDEGTMIDSHVLIGSCAQIGKRVHLSTAVQIGGVLEPIRARPVIVEDDCFIGAGAILTEGILVGEGAVIAAGVSLSLSVPIFDCINQEILYGTVPPLAVVVPGSRPINNNEWSKSQGLSLSCGIIIKYRDKKTDAALVLESALRN